MRLILPVVAFAAFAASSALSFAQSDAAPGSAFDQDSANQTYTLHRNVSLVTLDGVALDANNHVVKDLKQSDFTVLEDGVPQKIRFFTTAGENMPDPDITVNSTAVLARLAPRAPVNIVVLDEYSVHFEDMAFARYSLKKWLEHQTEKLASPTMLVAVNLQSFTVVRDYTQNKADLLTSLDKHFSANPWVSGNSSWTSEQVEQTYNTLRRIAEATSAHEGHKNVLWLGRGFPLTAHFSHAVDAHNQSHTMTQLTIDELREARVTLYTIDPAGVMMDSRAYASNDHEFVPVDGGVPGFERLAVATGGIAMHGRNDVDAEIGSAVQEGANLYSLTYTPSNPTTDTNKFRSIRVTVDRPGVTFYTHHGYYPADKPAKPRSDGTSGTRFGSEMLNAVNSNMQYDAVAFSATPLPADPNMIAIHVQSKGLAFYITNDSRPRYTRVIVMAKTTDAKGKQLWTDARSFEFQAPADVDQRAHLDLPVLIPFKLPDDPKATHVRFVVRVESSGHMGTAEMDLGSKAPVRSASFVEGPEAASLLPIAKPAAAAPATQRP